MPTDGFYESLPILRDFTRVMDPRLFAPLPDDWMVGVADVVQSTKAIAENRYKAVNMAGAAVIVAITNALDDRDFPFVFGGDGASFAVAAAGRRRSAAGARRNRDLGEGRPRPHLADRHGAGRRHPRARLRRPRRPLCAVAEHLDCHVRGRRHRLGGRRDEARRNRGRAGAARRAPRPLRPVMPLSGNPGVARRGALIGGRSRTRGKRGCVPRRDRAHRKARGANAGRLAAGGGPAAAHHLAAGRRRPRGAGVAPAGRVGARAQDQGAGVDVALFPDHAFQHQGRQLHSGEIHQRGGRQLGFPEIRRLRCAWCSIARRSWRTRSSGIWPTARQEKSCAMARTASTRR